MRLRHEIAGLPVPRRWAAVLGTAATAQRRRPGAPWGGWRALAVASMDELITRLRARRAELVETMAREIAAEGDWHCWLPLLAQVEAAIRAVEAVIGERS